MSCASRISSRRENEEAEALCWPDRAGVNPQKSAAGVPYFGGLMALVPNPRNAAIEDVAVHRFGSG